MQTDRGRIEADDVVLCGGMWTRDLAARIGVTVPLHACEHYYVLFQDVPGLKPDLPVLRDYDHCSYFKYDAGKLLVGAFEPHARPWGADGIPEDFSFGEIAGDFSHFEPVLLDAMRRIPALEKRRHPKVLLRPGKLHARRALPPGRIVRTCAIASSPPASIPSACNPPAASARWSPNGSATATRRSICGRSTCGAICRSRSIANICAARVSESLGLLVRDALAVPPIRNGARRAQIGAARPLGRGRRVFRRGVRLGAAPTGTRPAGVRAAYEYSYGRQNWFEHSAHEHRAVRSAVGIFDQSSFAKFRLEGADAVRVLNRVCANDVAVAPGKIIYTQWLNERGGIEADLTVTRLSESGLFDRRRARKPKRKDFNWLQAAHRARPRTAS